MARLYIDFERYGDKIIEVGAILVFKQELISSFHSLVNTTVEDETDYHSQAQYCHCIRSTELMEKGNTPTNIRRMFCNWIKKFDFSQITIFGHGEDVTESALKKWNPELDQLKHLVYQQVNLPSWIQRELAPYHISAFKMKEISAILKCSKENHQVLFKNNPSNHSRISRIIYKHHCALVDAFELAFYECELPLFCCDKHFESVICKHANQYMISTTTLY